MLSHRLKLTTCSFYKDTNVALAIMCFNNAYKKIAQKSHYGTILL